MTDAAPGASADGQATVEQAALAEAVAGAAEPVPPNALAAAADPHPEHAVGAAFAGGLVLALLLKRLAR